MLYDPLAELGLSYTKLTVGVYNGLSNMLNAN